jgi:hypothetical protein
MGVLGKTGDTQLGNRQQAGAGILNGDIAF